MIVQRTYVVDSSSSAYENGNSAWSALYIVFLILFVCAIVSLCAVAATPTYYYADPVARAERRHKPKASGGDRGAGDFTIELSAEENPYYAS